MKQDETFLHFLLEHQQKHGRTLNFAILMESILSAARSINHHYNVAAERGNLGEAGSVNVQGENVMQLDLMAHEIVMHYLSESRQVMEATSEEVNDEIRLDDDGRYILYFDPLDGSSNIKHNLPVGFLFGIVKRNLEGDEDYHLRKGEEFIAAGMFIIPTGVFTFSLRDAGTWRFILDQSGVYVRPQQVMLPESSKRWELSFNSANNHTYAKPVADWLDENQKKYGFRYAGSLAVDFHRLLHNGGMFCYPAIVNHPDKSKNRPKGKLRLMYECSVVAFIAREAGGFAVDENGDDILAIQPEDRHQRSAIYIGSRELVEDVQKVLKG